MFLHTTPFVLTPNSTRREKFDDGVTIVTYGSKQGTFSKTVQNWGEKVKKRPKKVLDKVFRPPHSTLKIEKIVQRKM